MCFRLVYDDWSTDHSSVVECSVEISVSKHGFNRMLDELNITKCLIKQSGLKKMYFPRLYGFSLHTEKNENRFIGIISNRFVSIEIKKKSLEMTRVTMSPSTIMAAKLNTRRRRSARPIFRQRCTSRADVEIVSTITCSDFGFWIFSKISGPFRR